MPEQENLFHHLLAEHLKAGTAPKAAASGGWTVPTFAKKVGYGERTVRSWLDGFRVPDPPAFDAIRGALFGDDPRHDTASQALEQAWENAREKRGQPGRPSRAAASAVQASTITPPDRLLGRDDDLAALVAALLAEGGTTALILGEGGVGKTTLTRAAATHGDIIARFGQRRHEVPLATASSAAAMQDAIATALGADPKAGMNGIRARLAAPALLLLDNFETPWEAEPDDTEALLRDLAALPGVVLLASLRGAESPRRPDWSHRLDVRPLSPEPARALFLRIAHRIHPDDPDLDPLLRELGGLPLAIELLAWQAEPETTLRRVMDSWRRLGPSLRDARADPAHRHASLARSIEVSLASPRLGEPGRRLFRLLGALPAGLAPEDEVPLLGEAVPEAVRQLRAVALLRDRAGRLDLLPPIRRHAAEAHPPGAAEQRAWIAHYLALVGHLGGRVGRASGGAQAAARLLPELANLEAALAKALPAGLHQMATAVIANYGQFGAALGVGSGGLRALAAAFRAVGAPLAAARCSESLGAIALHRAEYDVARQEFGAAERSYRECGNHVGEATCIHRQGAIALELHQYDLARQAFELALTKYRPHNDRHGEADCLKGLADVALFQMEFSAASQYYKNARILYSAVKEKLGEANCIARMAEIALVEGDHAKSQDGFETALPIFREIGDVVGEAQCLVRSGELAARRGQNDEAWRLIENAIALFQRVNSNSGIAWAMQVRAHLGV